MSQRELKIRLAGPMSIFNAEAQANIAGIKITRRWVVDKRIIMTDSLSNIVAQEETFTRGNSKKMVLKDLMAEEGSNLKLMWVPAHVDIKGIETADKAANEALNQEVDNTYKVEVRLEQMGEAEKLASKAGRMEILRKPHGDG
jgi:ribonuclease HI